LIGGHFDVCDRARSLGLEIFLIQNPKLLNHQALSLAHDALITNYVENDDWMSAIAAIHHTAPFDAVISLTEPGLRPAAKLAKLLNLPGMPTADVVENFCNKHLMRVKTAHLNPEKIKYQLGSNADDVRTFGDMHGYPLIIKPLDSTGSRGVRKICSEADLHDIKSGEEILIETFFHGNEYSVEAFSFGGNHKILAVTEKTTNESSSLNPFVETAHHLPARLDNKSYSTIEKYLKETLDALGFKDGPSHTELKLTNDGPRLIETHPRYGGDYIAQMTRLVTGYDIISSALAWPLGLIDPIDEKITYNGGSAVKFLLPKPGTVTDILGAETARGYPGIHLVKVNCKRGDRIEKVARSGHRSGFIVSTSETVESAIELCEQVAQNIQIITV